MVGRYSGKPFPGIDETAAHKEMRLDAAQPSKLYWPGHGEN